MAMFRGQINLIELIKMISLIIQSILIGWNYYPIPPSHKKKKNPCLRLTLKFAACPSRIGGTDGCCGLIFFIKTSAISVFLKHCVPMTKKRGRVSFKAYVDTHYPSTFRGEGECEGDINGMCPITPGRPNYSVRARDPLLRFPHYECI